MTEFTQQVRLGTMVDAVADARNVLAEKEAAQRLAAGDASLWPVTSERPSDRLGWLGLPAGLNETIADLRQRRSARRDQVVLIGMGGSSLAPMVFSSLFPGANGRLVVLDSSHPAAVAAIGKGINHQHATVIVASKSGSTVETISGFRWLHDHCQADASIPELPFVAISDPGTALTKEPLASRFQQVLVAPPDVGGRFSALSVFGLAPAIWSGALSGLPESIDEQGFRRILDANGPAAELAAAMVAVLLEGGTALELVVDRRTRPMADWIEQLVAESLGKHGRGLVPIIRTAGQVPDGRPEDPIVRVSLDCNVGDPGNGPHIVQRFPTEESVLQAMYCWQAATALAGVAMEINPFDQPDVESAKSFARKVLEGQSPGEPPMSIDADRASIRSLTGKLREARWITVQGYVADLDGHAEALERLRCVIEDIAMKPVTAGFGPRFLHSTGQLHKGGPTGLLAIQIVDEPDPDMVINKGGPTFGQLIRAQADGDAAALDANGQSVVRIVLRGPASAEKLAVLATWLQDE